MPHGTFDAFSFAAAFVLLIVLFLLKNLLQRLIFRFARRHGNVGRRAIVIGNSADGARAFVREAEYAARRGASSKVGNQSRITVLGTVGDFPDGLGCPNLGGVDRLCEILETLSPDYAVFAIESYEKDRLIRLVNLCDDKCVKVYFLPMIYGYLKSEKQVEIFGTTPLINIHTTPLDVPINAFLKRTFDIFGSAVLIILTSPIMLFCAFGVKLTSRGSVLFRQRRVGRFGREFTMLKFRSMRDGGESENNSWSTGVDSRKTKFGNFLRKTSLDELPQLFNVLSGKMSLVGPRPEMPYFVDKFRNEIPLYMVKHYVKPGMTGLAQINGLRGDTSISDRIHADLFYIESWTPLLDLLILLKTPFRAINRREVYENRGK